jgi:hypothetical protein
MMTDLAKLRIQIKGFASIVKRVAKCGSLLFVFLAWQAFADSQPLLEKLLAPLKSALLEPPPFTSIEERSNWFAETLPRIRREASESVFKFYLSGQLDVKSFEESLTNLPERQAFFDDLQSVFYDSSLARLRAVSAEPIRKFFELYDKKVAAIGGHPIFRLTGHYSPESKDPLDKGGFHRASGSIYANFAAITPGEWYIIFIHELLHSLDENLWQAVDSYGSNPHVKDFVAWAGKTKKFRQLSGEQKVLLREWIRAGLDRGLWAEYRAWAATFAIYRAGRVAGTWPRMSWMESLISRTRTERELLQVLYRYLDQRSKDPRQNIFSLPLIQDAIRAVREEARRKLPPLGYLAPIVTAGAYP